jgi:hypothetical protein
VAAAGPREGVPPPPVAEGAAEALPSSEPEGEGGCALEDEAVGGSVGGVGEGVSPPEAEGGTECEGGADCGAEALRGGVGVVAGEAVPAHVLEGDGVGFCGGRGRREGQGWRRGRGAAAAARGPGRG